MKIAEVNISEHYLISQRSGTIDYGDNFQLKTHSLKHVPAPKDCMVAFFKSFPPALIGLFYAREFIADKLGLKTADKMDRKQRNRLLNEFEGNVGDSITLFEVLGKSEIELLTGQKDKHLDFKLSFISFEKEGFKIVELATVVKYRNAVGRVYFFIVKPFHRFFMKRILGRMNQILIEMEESTASEMGENF